MKSFTIQIKQTLCCLLILLAICMQPFFTAAQSFGCSELGYLIQNNKAYAVNLSTGSYTLLSPPNGFGFEGGPGMNGVGYNQTDGMIWGHYLNKENVIGRLDAAMNLDTFRIEGLPIVGKNYYIGDVSPSGILYLSRAGGIIHRIDVNPSSATYLQYLGSINMPGRSIHDFAFNPIDGNLYTVIKKNNDLIRINPNTGQMENFGRIYLLDGVNTPYGAVYFGNDGSLYISANASGMIYKITQVQNLNVGDIIPATTFAFGPASSSNDGCRCPTAEVPQEIPDNGIDDDGDGLVDCEDPACFYVEECFEVSCSDFIDNDEDGFTDCEDVDCYNSVYCTAASAGGGGFESNGDLAQKIGKRDFRKVRYTGIDYNNVAQLTQLRKNETYGNNLDFRNLEVSNFMPIDAIEASTTYLATPTDLIELTNAVDAMGLDVYRGPGRIGAVLATTTEEVVYEHSKPICDRVKGNVLLDIFTEKLDGGNDFIVAKYGTLTGGTDYACSISARLKPNGMVDIENHWNIKDYPTGGTYFNFQVWATSIDRLSALVNEIILLFEMQAGVENIHNSAVPQLFVKSQEYGNGFVTMEIVNRAGATKLEFVGTNSRSETEDLVDFTWEVNLSGAEEETIQVPTDGIYNIGGDLTYEGGQNFDAIYAADGVWGLSFQPGGAEKESFDIQAVAPIDNFNGKQIERNVKLRANVKDYITIYRSISPAFKAYDLNEFNTLSFEVEGAGEVEVKMVKESIDSWENQPTASIRIDGRCKQVYLNVDDFFTDYEDTDWSDVQMVAFTFRGDGASMKAVEIDLSNVAFQNMTEYPDCDDFNREAIKVFPNPMKEELNFFFPASSNFTYNMMIVNQVGQVVMESNNQVATGNYINYTNNNLPGGMYFYYIQIKDGPFYSGKVIVIEE